MISALLSIDLLEIEEYYKKLGLSITENSNCLLVKEKQEVIASCVFELDSKGIVILGLEPKDDIALADFTLRSTLHIAAERCAMDATYGDTAPEELFEKLGFVLDKVQKRLDIDKLFKSCCGGCEGQDPIT